MLEDVYTSSPRINYQYLKHIEKTGPKGSVPQIARDYTLHLLAVPYQER